MTPSQKLKARPEMTTPGVTSSDPLEGLENISSEGSEQVDYSGKESTLEEAKDLWDKQTT
mgnify:CR=1 FL=1